MSEETLFFTLLESLSVVPALKNIGERTTARNYLEKCGLFSDFQYGFRSSRSTADFLTVVSEKRARTFNRSGISMLSTRLNMLLPFTHSSLMKLQAQYLAYFIFSP